MTRIACVGDNCIDYYDKTDSAFPGGNPVNVAVYVRRLGGQSSYIGAVGTDANGRVLTNALEGKGVDISHVQVLQGSTALTHVTLENGNRIFGEYDEGVMADFTLSDADMDFLCAHELVVSGVWGHAETRLGEVAARGVPVAFDCSDQLDTVMVRTALPHTRIAFFSDDDSDDRQLEARIRSVAIQGPEVVVATRGHRGSLAFDGEQFFSGDIVPCNVVDTMGAGDSFIAGFLYAWLQGRDIPECMISGAQASAVTIGCFGAW